MQKLDIQLGLDDFEVGDVLKDEGKVVWRCARLARLGGVAGEQVVGDQSHGWVGVYHFWAAVKDTWEEGWLVLGRS